MARGNLHSGQIQDNCKEGTGYKFQMFGAGTPTQGHIAIYDANANVIDGGAPSSGTVTSVGLTVPAEFSVAGSPVTASGTLAVTKANETANTVWAGPSSGAAAAPTFRALVVADVPVLTKVNGSALAVNIDNFSDSTPGAPAGWTNIRFLSDASGNISAYDAVGSWLTWSPTYSGSGSMTVTQTTLYTCMYLRTGPIVFLQFFATLTLGGTASNVVNISLPIANAANLQVVPASVSPGGNFQVAFGRLNPNASIIAVYLAGNANYPLGQADFTFNGAYRVV